MNKLEKFNQNTITTDYIKNLVATTYIPTVDIWKKGDSITAGYTYITPDYIVKAKKSYTKLDYEPNSIGPTDVTDSEYFEIIEPYIFGKFYKGLTTNYISNSNTYDYLTHYYLGQYLRTVRDLYNINLMSLYNCFCGEFSKTLRIIKNNEGQETITDINTKNDGYKVMLVPIRYFESYTIFLNSNTPVKISFIYYDGISRIKTADLLNITTINRISYNEPYLFTGINANLFSDYSLKLLEEYAYIMIQVPESNTSGLVVLEGDYTNRKLLNLSEENNIQNLNTLPKIMFGDDTNKIDIYKNNIEDKFISYPSLLRFSDNNYAFSNRLIEYLTLNAITPMDNITQDIQRIQEYASSSINSNINRIDRYSNPNEIKGIWSDKLRLYLYELSTTNYLTPQCFDINGYVDKDTENIIERGQNG